MDRGAWQATVHMGLKKSDMTVHSTLDWTLPLGSFPSYSDSKESACNAEDTCSIPGSDRTPEEGNGNPLQYSCLEKSTDRGTFHGVAKSRMRLSNEHTLSIFFHSYTKMLQHY